MSTNIITSAKPILFVGIIFGIVPLCLEKTNKNRRCLQIVSFIYSGFLIAITIFVCNYYVFYAIGMFVEVSFVPVIVHQAVEILFSLVTAIQIFGIFYHRNTFLEISKKFKEFEVKVRF